MLLHMPRWDALYIVCICIPEYSHRLMYTTEGTAILVWCKYIWFSKGISKGHASMMHKYLLSQEDRIYSTSVEVCGF